MSEMLDKIWDTCVLRAAREVVFIERKTEDIFDKSQQQPLNIYKLDI